MRVGYKRQCGPNMGRGPTICVVRVLKEGRERQMASKACIPWGID